MSRSHAQLTAMTIATPDFRAHFETRPVSLPPSLPNVSYARNERRKHIDALSKYQPIPSPFPDCVDEKQVLIAASDGFMTPVAVYSPPLVNESTSDRFPVFMLMHEGGWHLGDRKDEEMNARLFVRDLTCIALNVECRLAPEYPFPIYVEDSSGSSPKAFHRLANLALGIVLGGSSAGSNLAAVLAQKARVEGFQPPVTGKWLSVAALLTRETVPEKYKAEYVAMDQNTQDPVIGVLSNEKWKGMESILGIKNADDRNYTPFATPIYPPKAEANGMVAKAFFQVAGMDPLRDDRLIYLRSLREELGVDTRLKVYDGYGHMFWTNWPEMEQCKLYWRDMVDGMMRWLVGQ